MSMTYKLSTSLHAHDQDVRRVRASACISSDIILSAARDKTVRSWERINANDFSPHNVYLGHGHYVNALAAIPPSPQFPSGLFVSGGSDKLIHVYDVSTPHEPLYTLIGHSENVSALAISPGGNIISGSWDKNVIVWKDYQKAYVLEGHTAAVWAVLAIEDDLILTASADKTIRMWKNGQQIKVMHGHTDAVRGLALVPGIGFLSCSNDASLRVWTLDGDCIQQLYGHSSFVYSVAVLSTGEFVSSGEDRTVRIWKADQQCIQTIQQPCISVWTVSALPNDDIVVGGSDAVVRVFTRAAERAADIELQKQFDELLASQAIPSNQIGDVNKQKLPGPEALSRPGNKEGQVIMVNVNGSVEAHQWSAANQSWQKIGEVVGGVGSGKRQIYEGKEYDYVFDIDIGAGPNGMLKLPYNISQNPFDAAQKFIAKHDLSPMYLDQIADFITKNTEGVQLGQSSEQYQDPFTGKLSSTTYLSLKQTNLAAVEAKLRAFNTELGSAGLSEAELAALSRAVDYLNDPQGKKLSDNGLLAIVKVCQNWPSEKRFPGLDLLRLLALYSPETLASGVPHAGIVELFITAGQLNEAEKITDKISETNAMLAYRGLSNLFNHSAGRELLWEKRQLIMQTLQTEIACKIKSKPGRLAVSTLAVNFSVQLTTQTDYDEECQIGLASSLSELIKTETDDESVYRLLAALGTLVKQSVPCREVYKIMGTEAQLQHIKSQHLGQERINKVAGEILEILRG
ncbi:hypothetical protein EC973_000453 [Apophysomyces ossiformis]|uniref:Phospholipase A-2-activating protein n=1 Tax=Apophysomyces ossiformis TaxID=679940 RepID=A0A8H7EP74_9FUNG|nr:hypothetical protein EC973_000453 [Apophysomyces ossiformis]